MLGPLVISTRLPGKRRTKPRDEESAEVRGDMSDVSLACAETGMIEPYGTANNWDAFQDVLPKLEEECVLSGRTPTENRCSTKNLSTVCRESVNETTERLIYVYQGTPEERAIQKNCKGELLSAKLVSGNAIPSFKNTTMRRIATCAPVPTSGRE